MFGALSRATPRKNLVEDPGPVAHVDERVAEVLAGVRAVERQEVQYEVVDVVRRHTEERLQSIASDILLSTLRNISPTPTPTTSSR
jgi:hypothetical protein